MKSTFFWLVTLLYVTCAYAAYPEIRFPVPAKLNTQGQVSSGFVVSSNTVAHMMWSEMSFIKGNLLGSKNAEISHLKHQVRIGTGVGWHLNKAGRTLKTYLYKDLSKYFFETSGLKSRHLAYTAFIGGIEVQLPPYKISINTNRKALNKGQWCVQKAYYDAVEECTTIPYLPNAPDFPKSCYYVDLFRHKFDLIDSKSFGLSTQLEWNVSRRTMASIGIYYDQVEFLIPNAGYQHCRTGQILYDFQFTKQIIGLHIGFRTNLSEIGLGTNWGFIDWVFNGNVDTFNGGKVILSLELPTAYSFPTQHINPSNYTRTILASQWVRPSNRQKTAFFFNLPATQPTSPWRPDPELRAGRHIAQRLERQLTFNAIPAMRKHMLKMAQHHESQPHSPKYLKVSKIGLQNYLENAAAYLENAAADVRRNWGDVSRAHYLASRALRSDITAEQFWDVSRAHDQPLKALRSDVTAEQFKGIQFFLNAAHLFHTLDPGSAFGIIQLARNKVYFKVGKSSYEKLPYDINHIIIDYLLLDKTHVEQVLVEPELQDPYRDRAGETKKERYAKITMMRNTVVNTLV